MTVPARTNTTVAAAEVLIAHSAATATAGFLPECRCGWIGSSWLAWVADLAQHQADVLARVGLLADPTARTAPEPTNWHATHWHLTDGRCVSPYDEVTYDDRTVTDWTPDESCISGAAEHAREAVDDEDGGDE